MADISNEIAALQAASHGEDVRQTIVDALNAVNGGTLPEVSSSDAGSFLVVNDSGEWEVDDSSLMPVPTDTLQISANDTYDVTNYASAVVNVSGGGSGGVIQTLNINANGIYNAPSGIDGYNPIIVNVSEDWNEPIFRNWDFSNPLNTRNSASYSGNDKLTINGWKLSSGSLDIINGGINLNSPSLYNVLQVATNFNSLFADNDVTLTLLVNNKIATSTFRIAAATGNQGNVTVDNVTLNINRDSTTQLAMWIGTSNSTALIQAVKLEFGNAQTLAKQVGSSFDFIKHQDLVSEEFFARKIIPSSNF